MSRITTPELLVEQRGGALAKAQNHQELQAIAIAGAGDVDAQLRIAFTESQQAFRQNRKPQWKGR